MLFKLKIRLPLNINYSEEVDIDDNIIKKWDNDGSREYKMEEYVENWALDQLDFYWEEANEI